MKLTLPILAISATMFASSASAFDPADLQKLLDTNECVRCDLSMAFLIGADLTYANLRYANLGGADLGGADLMYADLMYADLGGADLGGAYLLSAYLLSANLREANLRDANLEGANLEGGNLFRALMKGAILCNTTMPDGSVIYSGC
jgi:uncharacterized protein YjbI with pentapeptide repeats